MSFVDCIGAARKLGSRVEILKAVLKSFENLPYENITKIQRAKSGEGWLHTPEEIIRHNTAYGTGGTCFSLVYLLKRILDDFGIESRYVFADRHYGRDTHCALIAELDKLYLCDPGYFIYQPAPLGVNSMDNGFNIVDFEYPNAGQIDVYTVEGAVRKKRYTIKLDKISEADFLSRWHDSYSWGMMETPVVMKKQGGSFYYMRPGFVCVKSKYGTETKTVHKSEFAYYLTMFGINLHGDLLKAV